VIIRLAESTGDVAAVRELWLEYWESIGLPMDFQGFGEEWKGLPGAYGAAGGALLLALNQDEPAGTVALRRLDGRSGEVKRLFLRPQYRGQGLAKRLLDALIERAIEMQYEWLYADTLPSMKEAIRLYAGVGFEPAEVYSNTPTPGAIYLKIRLVN
jgi:GNAT superfamily N-acetyltransferase